MEERGYLHQVPETFTVLDGSVGSASVEGLRTDGMVTVTRTGGWREAQALTIWFWEHLLQETSIPFWGQHPYDLRILQ